MLTTRHLILVDSGYARFEPTIIPLLSVLSVTAGKVASGEPVITLSFPDEGSPGGSRQMNLIFSQYPGEQRKRERDAWLRKFMGQIVSVRQHEIRAVTPPAGQEQEQRPSGAAPHPVEMILPYKSIVGAESAPAGPVILPDEPEPPAAAEEKTGPAETVTGPEPLSGDVQVPPEKEPPLPDLFAAAALAVQGAAAVPEEKSGSPVTGTSPPITAGEFPVLPEQQQAPPDTETPAAPAVPESRTDNGKMTGLQDLLAAAGLAVQEAESAREKGTGLPETVVREIPEAKEPPAARDEGQTPPGMVTPAVPVPVDVQEQPEAIAPPQPPGISSLQKEQRRRRHTVIAVAAVILLILAVAGGAFFYSQPGWGTQESPPPVAATPPAVQQTPVLPPAVIPQNGVWVKVAYNGSYIGSVGNPGSLDHVGGSGDRFFRIRDSEGLVQASFQKQDYSGKTLALEVYRDGEMVCNRTVRAPMGAVDILIDPRTGKPPGSGSSVPYSGNHTGLVPDRIYYY
jgi:hypothetical protein